MANQKNTVFSHFKHWLRLKPRTMAKKAASPFLQGYAQSFYYTPGKPVWSGRSYSRFAEEGYVRNVIAHRCITLIASGIASVPWQLYHHSEEQGRVKLPHHPVLSLIKQPNPTMGKTEFLEAILSYYLIGGNVYVQAVGGTTTPQELYLLRPDRVQVIAGQGALPEGYRYTVGDNYRDFRVNPLTGQSDILHIKHFHPLNDWYGLSPVEAAAYAIDQHNQAGEWNQALLQNGARPSGALVVKSATDGNGGYLSEEQYQRIRSQLEEGYTGAVNAGRPLLLEGGLDWREMSLSPKDMDFMDAKNGAARDIALAFGIPPQMLGIPGDNTYSNLAEARLALWEQTILPLLERIVSALNGWLLPRYGQGFAFTYDANAIMALAPRREALWKRIGEASFLSDEEKREMLGFGVQK